MNTESTTSTFQPRSPASKAGVTRYSALLVGLVILGLALRLYHATTQDLWIDEVVSVEIATMPIAELAHDVLEGGKVLPTAWLSMAYYSLAKLALIVPFGEPETRLRVLSALIGTATIPVIAWTAAPFVSAPAALTAAALLTISPFHVWYSQEVRPYALLMLASTLAFGAFLRALGTGLPKWWIGFTGALVLALYTHPIAFVVPILAVVLIALRGRTDNLRELALGFASLAAAGVAFLPAIALIVHRGMNQAADARPVGLFDWGYAFYAWAVGFSLGPSPSELHTVDAALLLSHAPTIVAAALVFGVVGIAGAAALQKSRLFPERVLLWSWLTAPIFIALAIAATSPNPFNVRYAIVAYPAFVIVLGAGMVQLVHWRVMLGALIALSVVALSSRSLANLYFDPRYAKEACGALATVLMAEASADDLILVNAPYMAGAVKHYYSGPARVLGYPDERGPVDESSIVTDLATLVTDKPHVWLVLSRTFHGDRDGTLKRLLSTALVTEETRHLPGITLHRFAQPRVAGH